MRTIIAKTNSGEIVEIIQIDMGRVDCLDGAGVFRPAYRNVFRFGATEVVSEIPLMDLETGFRGRLTGAGSAKRLEMDRSRLGDAGIDVSSLIDL